MGTNFPEEGRAGAYFLTALGILSPYWREGPGFWQETPIVSLSALVIVRVARTCGNIPKLPLPHTSRAHPVPAVWRIPMTQQTTTPSPSTLHEKIARISAKLEETAPKFNGAMSLVPPNRVSQPAGGHSEPWIRRDS